MNVPLILISIGLGGLGVAVGIRKKDLTTETNESKNEPVTAKTVPSTENDENNHNQIDNSSSGGLDNADDLGESEKPE